MRALQLLQPLWVLMMLGLGLLLVKLLVLGLHAWRKPEHEEETETEEFPCGLRGTHYGIPRVLVLIYVVVGLGMVGHVLYVWLTKVSY